MRVVARVCEARALDDARVDARHGRVRRSSPRTRTLALQRRHRASCRLPVEERRDGSGDYFFVITPHATLGPPLTPDFGAPVIPWSGFP